MQVFTWIHLPKYLISEIFYIPFYTPLKLPFYTPGNVSQECVNIVRAFVGNCSCLFFETAGLVGHYYANKLGYRHVLELVFRVK